MSAIARVDRFQRRHAVVGFPIAVAYKFFDDQGTYLAALITYYALVSLLPLLLLASTILGFVLSGEPALQQRILDSAVGQFPGLGADLSRPKAIGGGAAGVAIGLGGALYGGLGVAQALQNAMNVAWAVPRNSRPNPLKARARSLLLLGTVGIAVLATTALSVVRTRVGDLGGLGSALSLAALVAVNAGVFTVAFRIATARALRVRDVLPGAILAAVAWQALQLLGGSYANSVANSSTITNAAFGVVLGLIAFLFLAANMLVFCVELNVVRVGRLHPRALLTPFTDAVILTRGDEDAYTGQARAQRQKGFEEIDVSFERE